MPASYTKVERCIMTHKGETFVAVITRNTETGLLRRSSGVKPTIEEAREALADLEREYPKKNAGRKKGSKKPWTHKK